MPTFSTKFGEVAAELGDAVVDCPPRCDRSRRVLIWALVDGDDSNPSNSSCR